MTNNFPDDDDLELAEDIAAFDEHLNDPNPEYITLEELRIELNLPQPTEEEMKQINKYLGLD